MVHRGIDPLSQPVLAESFRVEFPTQVTVYIVDDHEQEKEDQVEKMYRDRENENEEDTGFQDGFQRMEGIGRKGTGIGRLVMHQVDVLENPGMMDEPVHPVEVGIMYQGHHRKGQHEPGHAMLVDIGIETGVLRQRRTTDHDRRDKSHDKNSENRKTDLPDIVAKPGKSLLDLFSGQAFPE